MTGVSTVQTAFFGSVEGARCACIHAWCYSHSLEWQFLSRGRARGQGAPAAAAGRAAGTTMKRKQTFFVAGQALPRRSTPSKDHARLLKEPIFCFTNSKRFNSAQVSFNFRNVSAPGDLLIQKEFQVSISTWEGQGKAGVQSKGASLRLCLDHLFLRCTRAHTLGACLGASYRSRQNRHQVSSSVLFVLVPLLFLSTL
jgi:hypothetical protein